MKFFSAAPISTPTFRPAQFPAPQRQSAATDTGTQPAPQGSPVVTGFKPETRSKNVQLASPSAVAPDPQVVPAAQTPQVFQGPSATAPVQPVEETYPHPGQMPPPPPTAFQESVMQRVRGGQPLTVADVLAAQRDGADPAFIQAIRDYALGRGWNYVIPREGGLIETPAPVTTTTVAPQQQGMVVPASVAAQKMQNWNAIADQANANGAAAVNAAPGMSQMPPQPGLATAANAIWNAASSVVNSPTTLPGSPSQVPPAMLDAFQRARLQSQQFSPAATQLAGAVTRATNTPRNRSGIYTGLAR